MSNEFDYTKLKHVTSVDQSDREVPYNLRQSGPTKVEMLISTRVRKSPYWHLSMQAGCWRATVYNRIYHPRGYVKPEDGGAMVEYDAIVNHVTMWNVAVERQIRVKGPDAEKFTDYVITRDATKISPMRARYVILCNAYGGVLNDPILLRISEDEFWFSLSDSDIGMYLQGVNADGRFNCTVEEIDACPVQIQGPKSKALMKDLCGDQVDFDNMPFYGLAEANIGGRSCVISQSGFSGEAGYEIYLRNATLYAEDMWNSVLKAGKKHNLMVIAPAHHRRIQAGILSWGQDMDQQHNPFQCNLGYQVSLSGKGEWNKKGDYVGKSALEKMKVPENITVICIGKSTYARLGIIVNTTPAEAGWEGHLTLEFSNSSGADCRIYAKEGICQLLFFEGDPCSTTYEDRRGKYQNQPEKVTLAKI